MRFANYPLILWALFVFNIPLFSFAEEVLTPVVSGAPSEVSIPTISDTDSTPEIHVISSESSGSSEAPANNAPQGGGGMSHEMRMMRLTIQKPEKTPIVLENGRIVVSSVESYDVGTVVSSCSFLARNNIVALLDAMGIIAPWMAQGDANDLIRFGRLNKTLTSFTDKTLFLEALDERKDEHLETVFDIYRHVSTRSYALQGHRVAVFLGDDEEWYILDPIDGAKTREPQLFRTYLENDVDAEWLVRIPWYTMINLTSTEEFNKALPYFSPELQVFFHTRYFDSPQVIAQGVNSILPTTL